ncbi:hypothetical protein C923_00723 [Plasmodium falciparum UGT5.1]|uniref:B-block binding subunit of TFIIIC domain-containing protein n=1 Tax=Plasmodium falciparum UGT5.1 TaxID=1237627 RepID=W7JUQ7_PLAFA|nr:hypothetical protein C923_00723 [Plasmodium falciparum UGT5.1]
MDKILMKYIFDALCTTFSKKDVKEDRKLENTDHVPYYITLEELYECLHNYKHMHMDIHMKKIILENLYFCKDIRLFKKEYNNCVSSDEYNNDKNVKIYDDNDKKDIINNSCDYYVCINNIYIYNKHNLFYYQRIKESKEKIFLLLYIISGKYNGLIQSSLSKYVKLDPRIIYYHLQELFQYLLVKKISININNVDCNMKDNKVNTSIVMNELEKKDYKYNMINHIHSNDVHSNDVHSNNVHSNDVHSNNIHSNNIHSNNIHSNNIHSNNIHSNNNNNCVYRQNDQHHMNRTSNSFIKLNPSYILYYNIFFIYNLLPIFIKNLLYSQNVMSINKIILFLLNKFIIIPQKILSLIFFKLLIVYNPYYFIQVRKALRIFNCILNSLINNKKVIMCKIKIHSTYENCYLSYENKNKMNYHNIINFLLMFYYNYDYIIQFINKSCFLMCEDYSTGFLFRSANMNTFRLANNLGTLKGYDQNGIIQSVCKKEAGAALSSGSDHVKEDIDILKGKSDQDEENSKNDDIYINDNNNNNNDNNNDNNNNRGDENILLNKENCNVKIKEFKNFMDININPNNSNSDCYSSSLNENDDSIESDVSFIDVDNNVNAYVDSSHLKGKQPK